MKDKYFGISKRITPWREFSDFEELLAKNATDDNEAKHLYAEYYRSLNPGYYEKGKEYALKLYNQGFNKRLQVEDINQLYEDMVYCLHKYGYSFEDYLLFDFYFKNDKGRTEYIPDKLRYYYCDILNADGLSKLMQNKWECYKVFKKFYKREVIPCMNPQNYEEHKDFFIRNKKFIFKPLKEHSGHGIEIIDSKDTDIKQWFKEHAQNNPGIIEELIEQIEELNDLSPSSVNTCRVITFSYNNTVKILLVMLRMSKGELIVDNFGSGGIIANVDINHGILVSEGYDKLGNKFATHPLTKRIIPGFQLPDWQNAVRLINEMSLHINGATLIGWDLACTNKGWVLVEINENSAWKAVQLCSGRGYKKDLECLIDKYFEK